MIKIKTYSIKKLTLTNELLISFINNFWSDIFNNIKDTSYLMLMCKVQFTNEEMGHRTLGHLRKVNYEDKELFIDYLTERLGLLNDSYMTHSILNISFSYIIKPGKCTDKNRALLQDLSDKNITAHSFNNMKLPISMDPRDYGKVLILNNLILENDKLIYRSIVELGTKTFKIDISKDLMVNTVKIQGAADLEWVDTRLSSDIEDSTTFKREIKKSTIYFMDGVKVLRKQQLNAKPFRKERIDNHLLSKFYTLDIETIKQDNKIIPYLISAYNGKD